MTKYYVTLTESTDESQATREAESALREALAPEVHFYTTPIALSVSEVYPDGTFDVRVAYDSWVTFWSDKNGIERHHDAAEFDSLEEFITWLIEDVDDDEDYVFEAQQALFERLSRYERIDIRIAGSKVTVTHTKSGTSQTFDAAHYDADDIMVDIEDAVEVMSA